MMPEMKNSSDNEPVTLPKTSRPKRNIRKPARFGDTMVIPCLTDLIQIWLKMIKKKLNIKM